MANNYYILINTEEYLQVYGPFTFREATTLKRDWEQHMNNVAILKMAVDWNGDVVK